MVATLTYLYTTQAKVEDLVSLLAANLRLDDLTDPVKKASMWTDILHWVTDLINQHCEGRYEYADLATSNWVERRARVLAAHELCLRRYNQSPYMTQYNLIMEELESILDGTKPVPGLPLRSDMTPSMSNIRLDERFIVSRQRVQPTTSAGGTDGHQFLDDFPIVE